MSDDHGSILRTSDHRLLCDRGYEEGTLLDATFKPFGSGEKVPRNGRIKCGTESNGGFRNVTISDCVIETGRGMAFETVDGGLA